MEATPSLSSSSDSWCPTWGWLSSVHAALVVAAVALASASPSSETTSRKMWCNPCPQYSLSQLWGPQKQERPTLRSTTGLITAMVALSMVTGSAISLSWPSRRPWERLRGALSATMLLASKVAQLPSISRPSSTILKIKTGTEQQKSSFQITPLVWPAASFAPSVSCALVTAMWATLNKVQLRLTGCRNLPLEFSKKWESPRPEIHHFQRTCLLHTKSPSLSLVLGLLLSAALLSSEEWAMITYTFLRRIKLVVVL